MTSAYPEVTHTVVVEPTYPAAADFIVPEAEQPVPTEEASNLEEPMIWRIPVRLICIAMGFFSAASCLAKIQRELISRSRHAHVSECSVHHCSYVPIIVSFIGFFTSLVALAGIVRRQAMLLFPLMAFSLFLIIDCVYRLFVSRIDQTLLLLTAPLFILAVIRLVVYIKYFLYLTRVAKGSKRVDDKRAVV